MGYLRIGTKEALFVAKFLWFSGADGDISCLAFLLELFFVDRLCKIEAMRSKNKRRPFLSVLSFPGASCRACTSWNPVTVLESTC